MSKNDILKSSKFIQALEKNKAAHLNLEDSIGLPSTNRIHGVSFILPDIDDVEQFSQDIKEIIKSNQTKISPHIVKYKDFTTQYEAETYKDISIGSGLKAVVVPSNAECKLWFVKTNKILISTNNLGPLKLSKLVEALDQYFSKDPAGLCKKMKLAHNPKPSTNNNVSDKNLPINTAASSWTSSHKSKYGQGLAEAVMTNKGAGFELD